MGRGTVKWARDVGAGALGVWAPVGLCGGLRLVLRLSWFFGGGVFSSACVGFPGTGLFGFGFSLFIYIHCRQQEKDCHDYHENI